MNRILVALFLFSTILTPVLCQESDTILDRPLLDTIPSTDTVDTLSTVPTDSIPVYQQLDTLPDYAPFDPELIARQYDSLALEAGQALQEADTLDVKEFDPDHSPYKAIMYALVLPGLGQGYNKKYYKIPIVYGAIGGAGYAIIFNTRQYRDASYNYALSPDDTNERYLRYWRRNVELSYIGMILVYALQVIDAYVDAQLWNWDVNDNLSMRVAPSLQPMLTPARHSGHAYGVTCSIDLRRKR